MLMYKKRKNTCIFLCAGYVIMLVCTGVSPAKTASQETAGGDFFSWTIFRKWGVDSDACYVGKSPQACLSAVIWVKGDFAIINLAMNPVLLPIHQ